MRKAYSKLTCDHCGTAHNDLGTNEYPENWHIIKTVQANKEQRDMDDFDPYSTTEVKRYKAMYFDWCGECWAKYFT